jgi:hypothetical protein
MRYENYFFLFMPYIFYKSLMYIYILSINNFLNLNKIWEIDNKMNSLIF